jgi:response regulator of citrate/malate metabolism
METGVRITPPNTCRALNLRFSADINGFIIGDACSEQLASSKLNSFDGINDMKTFAQTEEPLATPNAPIKVWLVDDNARFRNLVADILAEVNGIHCVRQFSSPTELLSTLASKIGPDVILLDVQMGNENGVDAVRPIKSLARMTRVLMFTTCFDSGLRERALSDGASDYLIKGGPLDKLIESIRRHDDPEKVNSRRRRRTVCDEVTGNADRDTAETSTGSLARGFKFFRALWN